MYLFEEKLYDIYKEKLGNDLFSKIEKINPYQKNKGITEWLVRQYLKDNSILSIEDKIKLSLLRFDKLKKTNQAKEKDINKLDLKKLLEMTQEDIKSEKEKTKESLLGGKKLYEDNEWLLLIPETYESACNYGSGTKWCTASKEDRKKYDEYMSGGSFLIFLINKKTGEKYSISKERNSFVNAEDTELKLEKIKLLLNKLPEKIKNILEKDGINYANRNIKEKILKKINFNKEDEEDIKSLSETSRNNLLKTLLASAENNITQKQIAIILKYTKNISKSVKTMAEIIGREHWLI